MFHSVTGIFSNVHNAHETPIFYKENQSSLVLTSAKNKVSKATHLMK